MKRIDWLFYIVCLLSLSLIFYLVGVRIGEARGNSRAERVARECATSVNEARRMVETVVSAHNKGNGERVARAGLPGVLPEVE